MSLYPNCDKLASQNLEACTLIEFLEFLRAEGVSLVANAHAVKAEVDREGASLLGRNILCTVEPDFTILDGAMAEDLCHKFLGIDPKELKKERRAMLDEYQKSFKKASQ